MKHIKDTLYFARKRQYVAIMRFRVALSKTYYGRLCKYLVEKLDLILCTL